MVKPSEQSGLLSKVAPAVVIALLVGGSAPWWWQEVASRIVGDNQTAREELTRESVARISRFRNEFRLCEISGTFSVSDKLGLVDEFLDQIQALDRHISPRYSEYGMVPLVTELSALSGQEERAAFSSLTTVVQQLPRETAVLRDLLKLYGSTPNDAGGAEYSHRSRQQLGTIVRSLHALLQPWPDQLAPFPECGVRDGDPQGGPA